MFRKLMGVSVFVLLLSLVACPHRPCRSFEGRSSPSRTCRTGYDRGRRVPDRARQRQCLHPVHLVLSAGDEAIVRTASRFPGRRHQTGRDGDGRNRRRRRDAEIPWTQDSMDLSEVPRGRLAASLTAWTNGDIRGKPSRRRFGAWRRGPTVWQVPAVTCLQRTSWTPLSSRCRQDWAMSGP